jgi:PAS domain S-box-containing protein
MNEYDPSMAQSLKTKYLLLALGVGAGLSLLLGGFAYYEHRIDSADVSQLTYATVEQKLEGDLEARANSVGKVTGTLLTTAFAAHNTAAIASIAGRLLEERDIERVEVTDAHGATVFSGETPRADGWSSDAATVRQATLQPLIVTTAIGSGAVTSRVGNLKIWVSRQEMQETLASIRAQLEHQQGSQIRRMRGTLARITLPLVALGLLGAWFIGRQLARPISALIKSADRIGEGDYTRPLHVARRDEIGELQHALERMRQKLSETTITKNYLDTVLNSLSDSVIVTSPDGLIKSCNEASQRLLGYSEADLVGKPLLGFVDEAHRSGLNLATAAPEARETVLRTASGQTIPVSMASSTITSADPQFPGRHLCRAQHHRAQARRAAHPLSGTLRHADQGAESHAVSALAATGDRAGAPQSALARALVPGLGPVQGSQRHLRSRRRRPHPRDLERTPDPRVEQGHGHRPARRR